MRVTSMKPIASEPGKGHELAPMVTLIESGDSSAGSSGETSTETHVGGDAPPSVSGETA